MDKQEQTPKNKRLKITILVLAVLVLLSAGGLAARMVYLQFFAPAQSTVAVPDNLIGSYTSSDESSAPAESHTNMQQPDPSSPVHPSSAAQPVGSDKPAAVKLELYEGRPGDNQRFEVKNMLPGDIETRYFCVKAYHGHDIDLFFKANVTEQTKNLGDVLHVKVTHLGTGKVLCDASVAEVNGREFSEILNSNDEKATTAYYQIDVSLDTTVGNEYQTALLKADFHWYVKDEGSLIPPQTGVNFNLTLWITLAGSSLLLLLLLAFRRRKEDVRHA